MAAQIPVKAIYSGSDVTSLGEFASSDSITATYLPVGTGSSDVAAGDHTHAYLPLAGGTMTGNLVMGSNLVDGVDISARDAVLTSTATTASAAMPKAGGAFTGAITTNSTIDTVDIATRDGVLTTTTTTANAALPKAGGTMTGNTLHGDGVISYYGASNDLEIRHNGTHSIIKDSGTGDLRIEGTSLHLRNAAGEDFVKCTSDGDVELYHDNSKKLETASIGVTITGTALSAAGSGASPTYSFTSDTDSGMFSGGANILSFATGSLERWRMENDGDLHADGDVIAYSTTVSDERLKTGIMPITDALNKVSQLKGCTFTYTTDGKKSAGLIAQDVEKVLPSAVTEKELPLKQADGKEYKVLQYDQTIGLLVEAIKELTAKVEKLENK